MVSLSRGLLARALQPLAMSTSRGRATVETMVVAIVVYAIQLVVLLVGGSIELFALSAPLTERPWTIITSVYSHGGISHLLANLAGLLVFGWIVERKSTRLRFHAFILLTGASAGIAEVLIGAQFGPSPLVVGISGAVFALIGYVFAANPVTESVVGRLELSVRGQVVVFIIVALVITWVTRGERVAIIAHFTGLLLGLLAGRLRLLRASSEVNRSLK